jgi:tetratricopeptide (TPR) repeat protein
MARSDAYRRGEAALKAGSYDEARRHFRSDEETNGTATDSVAKLHEGEARLTGGDIPGAAALFEAVLDRNPASAEAYAGLARLALATGQVDAAKVHAMATVRLAPAQGLGWTLVGLVHETLGEPAPALEALRKGAALGPTTFLCQLNYGRLLAQQGRSREAVVALQTAASLEPTNPDAPRFLGMAYHSAKQFRLAVRAFEKAKDLAPKRVDAWATLGDVLFELQEFQAARDVLDRGLSTCGDHPALLEKALAATMMLDDVAGAVAYLERELKVAPEHEQAWLNLAQLALLQKDGEKAEQVLQALLQKNPNQWEAHFTLGNFYGAVPLVEKAEAAYRKAIALNPASFKPLLNLATLFIEGSRSKQHAEAVTLLERAKILAPPDEWRVPYNLALALVRLGKKDQARGVVQGLVREVPATHPLRAEVEKLEKNLAPTTG